MKVKKIEDFVLVILKLYLSKRKDAYTVLRSFVDKSHSIKILDGYLRSRGTREVDQDTDPFAGTIILLPLAHLF